MGSALRCIFMGTPEIAVASLQAMINGGFKPVCIVTTPDKPAGRGLKIHQSAVRQFSLQTDIPVLQPENLSDPVFLQQIQSYSPDLIVVVAFRKLPTELLDIPRIGAFNLHASLLPDYRGAAPIQWAVMNGEKETGVTTFMLDKSIDTGKIIYQESVSISETQTAGEIHDVLMETGARLVLRTLQSIGQGNYPLIDQKDIVQNIDNLHKAPKIFKEQCLVDWSEPAVKIHNKIRGLSPYPGAYTVIYSPANQPSQLKILTASYEINLHKLNFGKLETDGISYVRIACPDGFIYLKQVQLAGKKLMNIDEFLRGFRMNDAWQVQIS